MGKSGIRTAGKVDLEKSASEQPNLHVSPARLIVFIYDSVGALVISELIRIKSKNRWHPDSMFSPFL